MTLCVDVMFVNKIPFLVLISCNIKFGTVEAIPNCTIPTLIKGIHTIIRLYKCTGFTVNAALMDGEFEPLHGDLAAEGIMLNATAHDKHVGDIKHYIHTVKEWTCANIQYPPFSTHATSVGD